MPVQATLCGVLRGQLTVGIDVAAVDANRRRAYKPGPLGRRLVADHGRLDLGVDAELGTTRWTSATGAGKFGQCSKCSTSTSGPGTWRSSKRDMTPFPAPLAAP